MVENKSIPEAAGIILDSIYRIETGRTGRAAYETVYAHKEGLLATPITAQSVRSVILNGAFRAKHFGSSAAGAPQIMESTLRGLVADGACKDTDLFSPELQDSLAYALLKRRGYVAWMRGDLSDVGFALGLAREWASFPVLTPTMGAKHSLLRGQSYYAGDGLNKALVKPEEVEALLVRARRASILPPTPSENSVRSADWWTDLWAWVKGLFS